MTWQPIETAPCRECGKPINAEEIEYYEDRCEQCEQHWLDEIEAWRKGAPNEKFDRLYGDNRVKH